MLVALGALNVAGLAICHRWDDTVIGRARDETVPASRSIIGRNSTRQSALDFLDVDAAGAQIRCSTIKESIVQVAKVENVEYHFEVP